MQFRNVFEPFTFAELFTLRTVHFRPDHGTTVYLKTEKVIKQMFNYSADTNSSILREFDDEIIFNKGW